MDIDIMGIFDSLPSLLFMIFGVLIGRYETERRMKEEISRLRDKLKIAENKAIRLRKGKAR